MEDDGFRAVRVGDREVRKGLVVVDGLEAFKETGRRAACLGDLDRAFRATGEVGLLLEVEVLLVSREGVEERAAVGLDVLVNVDRLGL